MIKLTKLCGEEFILNAQLIRSVETKPDTYVILTTHEKFIVQESPAEVVRRVLSFSRAAAAFPSPSVSLAITEQTTL